MPMYSTKENILLTAAALKAYNIQHVVLSPGARNAPLVHTLAIAPFFCAHSVVDERSAAYFALGLIQKLRQPVAICCTSGTALLNYGPAIAEAFYQELPLLVLSADRSPAWIGQMDGQTLPQVNLFASITCKSVHLPEVRVPEDEWFCRRLLHEALLALAHNGPVHVNIPLSEPLFDFSAPALPPFAPMEYVHTQSCALPGIGTQWLQYQKRMVVVGQLPQNHTLAPMLHAAGQSSVLLGEHLANLPGTALGSFDQLLASTPKHDLPSLAPELLVTCGGHIISKHLKQFLRKHPPKAHWHISPSGAVIDLFQALTRVVQAPLHAFWQELTSQLPTQSTLPPFVQHWHQQAQRLTTAPAQSTGQKTLAWGEKDAVGAFLAQVPQGSALHLANSSSVRHAQRFSLPPGVEVLCNRGTSGIEGAISTAIGYASVHEGLTFLLIGDLSFLYDINALALCTLPANMRILLINNECGGIFYGLPGLEKSSMLAPYIAARHNQQGKPWAMAAGCTYMHAQCAQTIAAQLPEFTSAHNAPMLLEVLVPHSKPSPA